ncbi:hypothetical protein VZT92_008923 [Zoarces viviparus]|uniref:Spermatogenesis associated 7 n=1 Tax=Zoarces viviparus TaxID=48416 RepID=A0AAW1FJN0_ZOAVI
MESRIGSVSSGCSLGVRGQTSKCSPFCILSSTKLTKSIIQDHMVFHHKKVYSAKARIDSSVPKSLIHSVKYNDQIRQERLRKGGRPQSAHCLSQRNSRAFCSSAQSRLSVQYDDRTYLSSRSSTFSSPRFSSTFHAKEIVYQSLKVGSHNQSHHIRPASEIQCRSSEATSHRQQLACSLGASVDQSRYKTFQDPVQKTYGGDLLQTHSQHFTHEKPFTPKTLKSEKSSCLLQYRYYKAPRRKPTGTQDGTNSRLMRQETYHGSTKTEECTQDIFEPSQGFNTEHKSEEEFNGTSVSASRQRSRANKSRGRDLFDSSSRFLPEGWKSPTMKSVSAEEEELMYLEFISAVTEDILSREHISDRFLDWVLKRHIDMNRHRLDVGKMRHLLEVLRQDFEEPVNTSASSAELEKEENDLLDSFVPHLESGGTHVKTEKYSDPYASVIKHCDSPDVADPLLVSTALCSPESTAASPIKANEDEGLDDNQGRSIGSPWLGEYVSDNTGISEEDHQNQIGTAETSNEVGNENHEYTTVTSEEGFHRDQADVRYDGQSKELEDLGRSLSESLHVSSNQHCVNVETATEQHTNTVSSVSDDEF